VVAAAAALGCFPETPLAVIAAGRVLACSAGARDEGVRRGQKVRDAQSHCPDLVVAEHDPDRDARAFEPVLCGLEAAVSGVAALRPGTCAVRARGPVRYYGGEQPAARHLAGTVAAAGVADCRVGLADGVFAAEQAARAAGPARPRIVTPGESAAFLAPLPVSRLGRPDLAHLLRRLGLRTLGAFAAVPAADVASRFGPDGALAHRLAAGLDVRPVTARIPPPELTRRLEFDPPLDRADQVAFSVRELADSFIAGLSGQGLVCTELRVEIGAEGGEHTTRCWLHPRRFDAADVVDRVRWQLSGVGRGDAAAGPGGSGLSSRVGSVQLVPVTADPVGAHADDLWGGGPDERIHHALSRVQSRLGHEAVGTVVIGGGRDPGQRQVLVPWGERPVLDRSPDQPWPGRLPPPAPATVFTEPRPAVVVDADDRAVGVSGRGVVTAAPARFCPDGPARRLTDLQPVLAWAGPWPVDERWWDAEDARRAARFQLVGADGVGWLLSLEGGRWWTQARYD